MVTIIISSRIAVVLCCLCATVARRISKTSADSEPKELIADPSTRPLASVLLASLADQGSPAGAFALAPHSQVAAAASSGLASPKVSSRPSAISQMSTKEEWADAKRYLSDHPNNNIPPHIAALVGRGLHEKEAHPLGIIREKIEEYFNNLPEDYKIFLAEDPIVTTKQCFDDLRLPPEHPGRAPSDTYYITDTTLLRTHTSAHQSMHLADGNEAFLCAGDVYRRDEIDSSHYPAFHQLEAVKLFPEAEMAGASELKGKDWVESKECKAIADDLKKVLEGLMDHLFGETEKRWNEDYFPFTQPSFELEIKYQGEWLEVLGCGVIHEEVLEMAGRGGRRGWAFGLGLERLAMILFKIPDIRLFWTDDERFHKQFEPGKIIEFKPYSKYPPVFKDMSFWVPDGFIENDYFELARGVGGDLIEKIELIDKFTHPKTNRTSMCYRLSYRSMDRSLTNEEINAIQQGVIDKTPELKVELRM